MLGEIQGGVVAIFGLIVGLIVRARILRFLIITFAAAFAPPRPPPAPPAAVFLGFFFLGFGCVHCVDQLNALKPATEEFKKAGISIVTIGNQAASEVMASIDKKPMPFPIASSPAPKPRTTYASTTDFDLPTHSGLSLCAVTCG